MEMGLMGLLEYDEFLDYIFENTVNNNSDKSKSDDVSYDVWAEKDIHSFLTPDEINKSYLRLNDKFFMSLLDKDIKFKVELCEIDPSVLGFTKYRHSPRKKNDSLLNYDWGTYPTNIGIIEIEYVSICPHRWYSRGHMERVLLHEMCHLCQAKYVFKYDLGKYLYSYDNYSCHDDNFKSIMKYVNNSPNNTEGYIVEVNGVSSDYHS